jgi:hypothetical protein
MKPHEAIELIGTARPFDDEADRVREALRRMRHARRQQKDLAGTNRDVDAPAVLHGFQEHLAFDLMEKLGSFVVMVVCARVRAADDLHDELGAQEHLLVAYRRAQRLAIGLDPREQVDRLHQIHIRTS